MERIVKEIRMVITKQQDILFEQLNFGACDASLTAFKSKINLKVPNLFYEFYQTFNGSVEGALPVWGKMTILPLSGIVREKETLDKNLKNLNWNRNWLPFLMEDKGSFVCINLYDKAKKEFGTIIQYSNKKNFQPILFKSFKHWLEAFHEIIVHFEKDIVIDNSLYRSYFNSKIESLLR